MQLKSYIWITKVLGIITVVLYGVLGIYIVPQITGLFVENNIYLPLNLYILRYAIYGGLLIGLVGIAFSFAHDRIKSIKAQELVSVGLILVLIFLILEVIVLGVNQVLAPIYSLSNIF
jgi:hypothetical protein